MDVLVYADDGASRVCINQTLHTLETFLAPSYSISLTFADVLLQEPWESSTALLVIPGGRDLPYVEALQPLGTNRIRQYVENGGKFWGICAGAYFASSRVEFEVGRPGYEVIGPRELKFFGGTARGSVYPGFVYASESGCVPANITWRARALQSYQNGGCFFDLSSCRPEPSAKVGIQERSTGQQRNIGENDGLSHDLSSRRPDSNAQKSSESDTSIPDLGLLDSDSVAVLGWYQDVDLAPLLGGVPQPAVIARSLGKGRVVLSGTHLEYFSKNMTETLPSGSVVQHHLAPQLALSDDLRREVVREILGDLLGLELKP